MPYIADEWPLTLALAGIDLGVGLPSSPRQARYRNHRHSALILAPRLGAATALETQPDSDQSEALAPSHCEEAASIPHDRPHIKDQEINLITV